MDKKYAGIIEYANTLASDKLCDKGDFISLRDGDKLIITKSNADFSKLTESDIETFALTGCSGEAALHADIYAARDDISAIIHAHPENATAASRVGASIPAVLDDVAQIVGSVVKVAKGANGGSLVKALKGKYSCLIKSDGAIASGRTLDEAHTCCLVLEKGAKCYIEGSALGGAKKIGWFDAKLMRFVYKMKYSKQDQSAKMKEQK